MKKKLTTNAKNNIHQQYYSHSSLADNIFRFNRLTRGMLAASALLLTVPAWAAPLNVTADKMISRDDETDLKTINAAGGGIQINDGITLTLNSTKPFAIGEDWTTTDKITGMGGLNITGNGEVTLHGTNNDYTGATNITSGTLKAGQSGAFSTQSNFTISDGATLDLQTFSQSIKTLTGGTSGTANLLLGTTTLTITGDTNSSFDGKITGTEESTLGISGSGKLTLSGDNSGFLGSIVIAGGTLESTSANSLSASKSVNISVGNLNTTVAQTVKNLTGLTGTNISMGANLTADYDEATTPYTISSVISGAHDFIKAGAGDLILNATNTFTGATQITGGTLTIGNANVLDSSSDIKVSDSASLIVDTTSADITLSKVISGAGGLTVKGDNKLSLTGTNTYTGKTRIMAGTLESADTNILANSSAISVEGTGSLNITTAAQELKNLTSETDSSINIATNLTANYSTASTPYIIAGSIAGAGNFTKSGEGELKLTGTNTFTGKTQITKGNLTIVSGANLQNTSGIDVDTDAALVLDASTADITLAHSISGAGDVIVIAKSDRSIANSTLSAVSDYTGTTRVMDKSTLKFGSANAIKSSSMVNISLNGTVNLMGYDQEFKGITGEGSIIMSNQNLTINVSAGSDSNFMGTLIGTGSRHRFIKEGDGNLTLSGDTGGHFGITEIKNGKLILADLLTTGDLADKNLGGSKEVIVGATGQLELTATKVLLKNLSTATGSNVALAGNNLTIEYLEDKALAGNITGTDASSLTLKLKTTGRPANITLSGDNSGFAGKTVIQGVTLISSATNSLANSSDISLESGTLNVTTAEQTLKNLVSQAGTSINLSTNLTANYSAGVHTIAGTITGAATNQFTKTGDGTLILTGDNSQLLGATTVNAGTLQIDAANALHGTSAVTVDSATLIFNNNDTTTDWTFDKVISGTGNVTKTGNGKLILTAANTYTGTTTLNEGALQITNVLKGAATINRGILDFNIAGDMNYDQAISGMNTGTLNKSGAGTLKLSTADNKNFLGSVIINEGTLEFDKTAALSGSRNTNVNNGTLKLSGTDDFTLKQLSSSLTGDINHGTANLTAEYAADTMDTIAGKIIGTGNFTKEGMGTLILSGDNSGFSGNITVTNGVLQIDKETSLKKTQAVNISTADSSRLDFNVSETENWTFDKKISGAGNLSKSGTGDLKLTGENDYTGATIINDGTLTINAGNNLAATSVIQAASAANLVTNATVNFNLANTISGDGGLIVEGSETVTLTAKNSYKGKTVIMAGTLQLGVEDAIRSSSVVNISAATSTVNITGFDQQFAGLEGDGNIITGAQKLTLNTAADSAFVFNGNLTASTGSLDLTGTGTQTFNGTANSIGAVNVNSGTLLIGDQTHSNADFTSTSITVASGATFGGFGTVTGPVTIESGAFLSPGTNGVIGNLTINNGKLTFKKDSTLNYDIANTDTENADLIKVTGTGSVSIEEGSILKVVPAAGAFTAGRTYTVIESASAIDKQGTGFTLDAIPEMALLELDNLSYNDNKVALTLKLKGSGETGTPPTETGTPPVVTEPGTGSGPVVTVTNANWNIPKDENIIANNRYETALEKTGTGKLTIQSSIVAEKGVTVTEGTLQVGDKDTASAILTSDIVVKDKGTLAGHGKVVGNVLVQSGGILAPGGSIGTLTINGDFTFDNNAGLIYDIADSGSADLVNVTGKATIKGGRLEIKPEAGLWNANRTYTVLEASKIDKQGEFTLDYERAGKEFALLNVNPLSYSDTRVTLNLTLKSNVQTELMKFAHNDNQRAVARALGSMSYDSSQLLQNIASADVKDMPAHYINLSPEIYASVHDNVLQNSRYVRNAVLQNHQAADPVWITAWGHAGSSSGDAKYTSSSLSNNGWGVAAGVDLPLAQAQNIRGGVMAGYERASLNQRGTDASARVNTAHIGAYLRADINDFNLHGGLIYSHLSQNTERRITINKLQGKASSNNSGRQVQLFAELNRDFHIATSATLTPYFNLAQVWQNIGDANEKASGDSQAATLQTKSSGQSVTFAGTGLRGTINLPTPSPASLYASAGWQHAFGSTQSAISSRFSTGDSFTTRGTGVAKNSVLISTGLNMQIGQQSNLTLSYQGEFATGRTDNGGKLQWQTRF